MSVRATAVRGEVLEVDAEVRRGDFTLRLAASVAPGEVLGVLGPNGAGKSTLLRALAGLTAITSGRITLGTTCFDDPTADTFVPAEHRPVGLVFQNYRLFPHLDVQDNVAFASRARGASRQRARDLTRAWLEQLDLTALAGRRPHELSGGQAQRVALARALAAEPGLLLLDEPLSALDARTRLDVRAHLRGYIAGFAGPTLVVTHDPLEAMVLADRLLVIEEGRVVQEGTPGEVARRPATQYVAKLVGLNLYAGQLGSEGRVEVDSGGVLHVTAGADGASELRPGARVLVGVRPSSITIHTQAPHGASVRNVWPGTVAGLELLADRVRVEVEGSPPAWVDVTTAAVADLGLRPGMPVWLSTKATEAEVYPDPFVSRGPGFDPARPAS